MLRTEARNLEFVEYSERKNTLQSRWEEIRTEVCSLIDYRLEYGSCEKWYEESYLAVKQEFLELPTIDYPSEINYLTSGIVGEVFFMDACNRVGINCIPTSGQEDMWGVDFKIDNGIETRFLDVSINISSKGLQKKNKAGTFPTLFVPWRTNSLGKKEGVSYSEKYLCTGVFDREKFISDIIDYNNRNLHELQKSVWKDAKWGEGYMSLEGIQYIKNLKGIIEMLKRRYYQ
ncbi:MAG: hypothetical protein RBT33_01225 [Candidatus Dojkabacteria bacterium]|nr:hypothetical protein [Candidatus Dojkabacteria bacterium]